MARRDAGLSQSVVAAEVGCKQAALSMFEQGDGTKLNDEVIRKLAEKFHVELPKEQSSEVPLPGPRVTVPVFVPHSGFCPNPLCPSHSIYSIEEMRFAKPDRVTQDPVGGKFCAVCGELLERKCPNCGAPVHDGAICSLCGEPYVAIM